MPGVQNARGLTPAVEEFLVSCGGGGVTDIPLDNVVGCTFPLGFLQQQRCHIVEALVSMTLFF